MKIYPLNELSEKYGIHQEEKREARRESIRKIYFPILFASKEEVKKWHEEAERINCRGKCITLYNLKY
ncbi:MAG: hypothetical protein AABX71_01835 [Nanoarchaeota archaeon]